MLAPVDATNFQGHTFARAPVRPCVYACVSVSVKHAGNFRHLSKDKRPKRGRFSFV